MSGRDGSRSRSALTRSAAVGCPGVQAGSSALMRCARASHAAMVGWAVARARMARTSPATLR
jgi:hypothetical protein